MMKFKSKTSALDSIEADLCYRRAAGRDAGRFKESDHPRDPAGKFGSGGGGGAAKRGGGGGGRKFSNGQTVEQMKKSISEDPTDVLEASLYLNQKKMRYNEERKASGKRAAVGSMPNHELEEIGEMISSELERRKNG